MREGEISKLFAPFSINFPLSHDVRMTIAKLFNTNKKNKQGFHWFFDLFGFKVKSRKNKNHDPHTRAILEKNKCCLM